MPLCFLHCQPPCCDPHREGIRAIGSKLMRVVLANRYFYPDQSATSRMVTSLAHALVREGIETSVLASRSYHDRRKGNPGRARDDRRYRSTSHLNLRFRARQACRAGRRLRYLSPFGGGMVCRQCPQGRSLRYVHRSAAPVCFGGFAHPFSPRKARQLGDGSFP